MLDEGEKKKNPSAKASYEHRSTVSECLLCLIHS